MRSERKNPELRPDTGRVHTPTMTLKNAALLALIGTILMTALLVWNFVFTVLNVLRGVVPPVMLFQSFIYAFGCFGVMVFFYALERSEGGENEPFSNRWYKPATDSAVVHELEPDLRVRVVTAVYFCATKLEAFDGRGKHDYQSSHDLEDLMAVVDGRPELAEKLRSGPEDVRAYIGAEFRKLLATPEFLDALPGYLLPDQASRLASRYCLSD